MTTLSLQQYEFLLARAETVIQACNSRGLMLATAESCTGGLITGLLTEISGSSSVVDRGFTTYSNEAKHEILNVPEPLLAEFGAVSAPVAKAMAEGALKNARADIAVAVTGIAGPGGGSAEKPVGTVHFGLAAKNGRAHHAHYVFSDLDRQGVRAATINTAFTMILKELDKITGD
ncbi:nicotinamide-nucleotide amidase [Roseibium hamelinense]|uniref:Nicotinamide-nucleotide amidase n=1 Tax=Roseibium hamelinense TaxID=150831 RepID=A0A562THF5_9HYPH|nr:CinA family protein [Roseibium hamelinense]MTI45756.1 CinA family protein [Roseibium hamelinense]TWI93061.1 nicotinamide-nucleotide amidase [Roseibium hamelinense]